MVSTMVFGAISQGSSPCETTLIPYPSQSIKVMHGTFNSGKKERYLLGRQNTGPKDYISEPFLVYLYVEVEPPQLISASKTSLIA